MPVLNSFLFSLDESNSARTFIVMFILFSRFTGVMFDPFKLRGGYAPLWLIILYCMGVLAKRINIFANKSSALLIVLLVICFLATWVSYVYCGFEYVLSYITPFVLMSGLLWLV